MRVQVKKWETEFFNIKIGEIFINSPQTEIDLRESGFKLIVASSEREFDLSITGYLNSYSGSLVLYEKKIKTFCERDLTNKKILNLKNGDIYDKEELNNLAYESGKFSRFRMDRKFKKQAFINLYQKWVENSLNYTIADEVLVFKDKENIHGFITYKINEGCCNIGLLGIKPSEQGKGIGGKLLRMVENKIFSQGVCKIKVKTQKTNIPANNFYLSKNFKHEEQIFIKHYWRNDTI